MSKRFRKKGAAAPFSYPSLEVIIDDLAVGGAGIARHDGMVIFIPMAAPGDKLLVKITKKKKNYAEAEILEILEAGPSRRQPPCSVANICGGCNWQHIDENEQRQQKQSIIRGTLKKFLKEESYDLLPLVASTHAFRYRNRIQPKAFGELFGFFARNSHRIVDINDCLITETQITEKFPEIRNWLRSHDSLSLHKMEVYLSEDLETVQYNLIKEESDTIGFSQVNRFQNQDLIKTVIDWTKDQNYKNIYDLYSGAGNFTLPLSSHFATAKSITGVELNPKLVQKGRESSKDSRVRFVESDVDTFAARASFGSEDLVILDPPRAGSSLEVMQKLASHPPKKIIYISCHPVSLARDLKWLLDESRALKTGLKLIRVQGFEMFPQTDHVETIVEVRVDS